jgi:hypothetical protein
VLELVVEASGDAFLRVRMVVLGEVLAEALSAEAELLKVP